MWFWNWLQEIYVGERLLIIVSAIAATALTVAVIVGYFLRNTGVYVALSAMIGGGTGVALACGEVGATAGFVGGSLLFAFGGALYLILSGALSVRRVLLERKRRRAAISRRLQYTLPDRENSYVRTRLNTALHIEEEALNADMGATETKKAPIKLDHARRLLGKVQEAPLTAAERLQAEEMAKTFSLYLNKEGWTAGDVRAVNELCAALLKLSAKYAV